MFDYAKLTMVGLIAGVARLLTRLGRRGPEPTNEAILPRGFDGVLVVVRAHDIDRRVRRCAVQEVEGCSYVRTIRCGRAPLDACWTPWLRRPGPHDPPGSGQRCREVCQMLGSHQAGSMPCWMQYCCRSSSLVEGLVVGRGDRGLLVRVVVEVGFEVGVDVVRSDVLVAVDVRVGRSVDR
jgi:hypothetical protein